LRQRQPIGGKVQEREGLFSIPEGMNIQFTQVYNQEKGAENIWSIPKGKGQR
jgi:hypothetical protein